MKQRTNLTLRYLPATVTYGANSNLADMPFVTDFDDLGDGFNGAVVLEHDRGDFSAGVYMQVVGGRWQLALDFKDLQRYMIGNDYDLEVIHRPATASTEASPNLVFTNARLDTAGSIKVDLYNVYAVLTPRSAGGSGGGTTEVADQVLITGVGTAADPFTLDVAEAAVQLQGKVGAVTNGTNITVTGTGTAADPYKVASTASKVALSGALATGHKIGTLTIDGSATDLKETLTTLAVNSTSKKLDYTDEAGTVTSLDLAPLVKAGETLTALDEVSVSGSTLTVKYTGENGTQVTKTATLPSGGSGGSTVSIANTAAAGHKVADITIDGTTTTINETVATLVLDVTSGTKLGSYTNEAGPKVDIYAPAASLQVYRVVATAGQTAFVLPFTPSGVLQMFRNGVLVDSTAVSLAGTSVTYIHANNGGAALGALVAGDVLNFYGVA